MGTSQINIPSNIQTKVDEIMSRNRIYSGYNMSLNTEVTPDPEVQTPPEQVPQGQQSQPGDEVFTKADIDAAVEKARQQEKDKLYGRVNELNTKLSEWEQREQERKAAEDAARQQAEDEARRQEEENLSAKELLARKEQEWQSRFEETNKSFEQKVAELQAEREQERALLEKERQFNALQQYTQRRLSEESDNIAPQFVDFIRGNSEEEIEQGIAVAKAKSAEIAETVQNALQQARSLQRGVSPTGYPPIGPMEVEGGSRNYSPQDIQNMDMAEYAKFRQQAGISGGAQSNRGLFG